VTDTPAPLTSSQLALLHPDGTTPRNYDNVVAARFAPRFAVPPVDFRRAVEHAVGSQVAHRLRFGAMSAWFDSSADPALVHFIPVDCADDVLAPLDGYSFDLAEGPLVCCSFAAPDGLVRAFALVVPHIVQDGAAQGLLLDSVAGALTGQALPTCDERQYRHHVASTIAVEQRVLAEHRGRWEDLVRQWLADRADLAAPFASGPADHRRPRRAVHHVPAEVAGAMVAYARQKGRSELDLVLAAYGAWLTQRTGAAKHLVRLIVGTRERTTPPFAGCLVNTVPLTVDGTAAPADLVAATAHRKRDALARRFLPYMDVCQRLLRHDEAAVDLLESATMVTFRRVHDLTGAHGERVADVDHTLPPAWPRAPVLLRVLTGERGVTLNVETDDRLPAGMHADRIVAGLTERLAELASTTTQGMG
jgi:hypothetical protein